MNSEPLWQRQQAAMAAEAQADESEPRVEVAPESLLYPPNPPDWWSEIECYPDLFYIDPFAYPRPTMRLIRDGVQPVSVSDRRLPDPDTAEFTPDERATIRRWLRGRGVL